MCLRQSVGSSYLAGLLLSTVVFCWFGMLEIYMSAALSMLVLTLEVFVVVYLIPSSS
jgi:hypothetical protein